MWQTVITSMISGLNVPLYDLNAYLIAKACFNCLTFKVPKDTYSVLEVKLRPIGQC